LRKIEYKASVHHDLRRLDRRVASRIIDKIEEELASADFRPVPLSGELKGLYKLRVGDYRVIYALSADRVHVLEIGHRSDIYR
jgi:mRNA interferase RelE/StbE